MRNISRSATALAVAAAAVAAVAAVAALGACGPSGKQVATAREARYQGDRQQIFAVIKQTVAESYQIERADDTVLGLQTQGRWYNPEGQSISANISDARDVPDRSLNVALVVELTPDGDRLIVSVKEHIMRYIKGRPNPDLLDEKDPSLPGWVHGKSENLQVAIYQALRSYEATAPGAPSRSAAPAPAAAVPAPAAPAPDPAAGPAAGAPAP